MRFSWWQRVVLGAIAVLFAIGTSILSWDNARVADLAPRFHWPDETANAYFATRVAEGESLVVPVSQNPRVGNVVHPRSVNVRGDGALVPGSFLGLPLWYGLLGRVLGARAMLFVTPLLAALGLLALAGILRAIAGVRIAMIAVVLLALHPSLWFFTATVFLPNVPFVALFLLGIAAAMGSRAWWRWGIAGTLVGLALTMRTNELVWVGMLLAALAWRQRPGWRTIAACGIGVALPFIPVLILNAQLYGNAFTTGYALLQNGDAAPTEFARTFLPSWLIALIAPFGWHPTSAFVRFWQYLVAPYWWFIALAALGVVMVGHRRRALALGTIAFTVWLILYYGSWELADPLVRTTNVFTISYVRYWLPIVIALAPWAAIGCVWLLDHLTRNTRALAAAFLIFTVASASLMNVINDPAEGLLRQRQAIGEHRVRARAVITATEPNAVIVSHRMDKVFFPERAVIHAADPPVADSTFAPRMHALADTVPTYWYAADAPTIPGFVLTEIGGMPFGEHLFRISTR